MKKLFITLILFIGLITFSQAQDTTSCCVTNNVEQGDILVGLNSQLSTVSISDLNLSPSVAYGITDDIFAGVSVSGVGEEVDLTVVLRGYVTELGNNRAFGQVGYTVNTVDDSDNFALSVGVTGFLNTWFYVEPTFNYNFGSPDEYGVGVAFGVRL